MRRTRRAPCRMRLLYGACGSCSPRGTPMSQFRKKPIVIEAMRWTGNNWNAMREFMGDYGAKIIERRVRIQTLEGAIYADEGDWIIRGIAGEFYPCKPDIFAATYEPASGSSEPSP